MEDKGCGCCGVIAAMTLGLVLGAVGLLISGLFWLDARVLAKAPVEFEALPWSAEDEARFANKLIPLSLAVKQNRSFEDKVSLTPREANHLLTAYILADVPRADGRLLFEDRNLAIRFSLPVAFDRYLNGELLGRVSGLDNEFSVEVVEMRSGQYVWPERLRKTAAYWIRGKLETWAFFDELPFVLTGISHDGKGATLFVKVEKKRSL